MAEKRELKQSWHEISDDIDTFWPDDFQITDKIVMNSSVNLRDRIAELCLNGFLPLSLLCSLCFLLATREQWALSAFCALVLGPLLAIFLRPFLCRIGTIVEGRILALAIPILLLCIILSVFPGTALRQIEGDYVHPGLMIVLLQSHLEHALSPLAFSLFLLLTLSMVLGLAWVKNRMPWCEPKSHGKLALAWRLVIILSLLCFGAWSLRQYLPLTESENNWISARRSELKKQPYFELPQNERDTFWTQRLQAFDDAKDRLFPGRDRYAPYSQEELARMAELVGLHLDLDSHPPQTAIEHEKSGSYYSSHLAASSDPDPSLHLSFMKLHFQARPTGGSIYTENRLPKVLKSLETRSANLNQLKEWRAQVLGLRKTLFTRTQELEYEVYRLLFSRESLRESDDQVGWQRSEEIFSWQKEPKIGWRYQGVAPTSSMKILGWTVENSPTQLFAAAQKRYLLRRWLSFREKSLNLTPDEQVTILEAERDNLGHEGTSEHEFWDQLSRENNVVREKLSLQTAELILALRIFYVQQGRYPQALEDLKLEWLKKGRYEFVQEMNARVVKDSVLGLTFTFPAGNQ